MSSQSTTSLNNGKDILLVRNISKEEYRLLFLCLNITRILTYSPTTVEIYRDIKLSLVCSALIIASYFNTNLLQPLCHFPPSSSPQNPPNINIKRYYVCGHFNYLLANNLGIKKSPNCPFCGIAWGSLGARFEALNDPTLIYKVFTLLKRSREDLKILTKYYEYENELKQAVSRSPPPFFVSLKRLR